MLEQGLNSEMIKLIVETENEAIGNVLLMKDLGWQGGNLKVRVYLPNATVPLDFVTRKKKNYQIIKRRKKILIWSL